MSDIEKALDLAQRITSPDFKKWATETSNTYSVKPTAIGQRLALALLALKEESEANFQAADKWEQLTIEMKEQIDDAEEKRDLLHSQLEAAREATSVMREIVAAAREMRMYCLGSDASTENMLVRFDEALAKLDAVKK